nr:hypothetical protein [Tanacetum cinerariifolium]
MESVKKSINERPHHKSEYDSWVNERLMQTTKEKVDTSKALDASLVDTERSRTDTKEIDTSSSSGNDAHDDDADIRPIYDEEPMAETSVVHEETMTPRSCLRWKPTGKIFKTVGLRWVPTGKIFNSSTTKVNSEPPNGSNAYITNQYKHEQTLDVSVGACGGLLAKVMGMFGESWVAGSRGVGSGEIWWEIRVNEYKGIMPTKIELTLEQSQKGVSNDVLVSIKGVEELKRNVWIKGENKEALHTTLGGNRVNTYAIGFHKDEFCGCGDNMMVERLSKWCGMRWWLTKVVVRQLVSWRHQQGGGAAEMLLVVTMMMTRDGSDGLSKGVAARVMKVGGWWI